MKTIMLSAAEMDLLMQPIVGQGGDQGLLQHLQDKLDKSNGRIELTDEDRGKICRHAFDYGNGGWENQLKAIFGRHLGEMT
ncbi:hypothetical protein [Actibacterium sp. XHP0104]|uniref:hypothetical protein n=1 Tax=Actibacterium sp. XHP0104 TaxID=2984335 RepID=UPI0021E7686E|nr:hypothetical protein [Actibacterium sp. XHP0104]MCV2881698.1 hypothetical protein [Actibacterium sp. XHP0104]